MKLQTLVAAAALMLVAGAASAQQGRGNPAMAKVREACAADMQKLCADKTGPDRRQCMMDHQADLSDGCKSALADARAAAPKPQQ